MRFRGRAAVTAVLFLLLLASPAAADPCALTDPECLTNTVDDTVETVEQTADSAEDTVNETVEDTTRTVDETTTEVVGQVGKVVDGLLGKGGDPDPGGGGHDQPGAGTPGRQHGRGGEAGATLRLEPREPSIDALFRTPDAPSGDGTAPGAGRAGGIGAAAKQLAFPALLASLVLAFLVIQNRLDRRDPRLASAPLGPELLTFE
jgi:hypothetical protein